MDFNEILILLFQIDFCVFAIFQNDFGKINPKLGPAIPPYNAHFDQYSRQYFKYKGLRKTLIRTGQVSVLEIRNHFFRILILFWFIFELSNFLTYKLNIKCLWTLLFESNFWTEMNLNDKNKSLSCLYWITSWTYLPLSAKSCKNSCKMHNLQVWTLVIHAIQILK